MMRSPAFGMLRGNPVEQEFEIAGQFFAFFPQRRNARRIEQRQRCAFIAAMPNTGALLSCQPSAVGIG